MRLSQAWRCRLGRHEPIERALLGVYTRCAYCDRWLIVDARMLLQVASRTGEERERIAKVWLETVKRRKQS